jgi:hypothetical protein
MYRKISFRFHLQENKRGFLKANLEGVVGISMKIETYISSQISTKIPKTLRCYHLQLVDVGCSHGM